MMEVKLFEIRDHATFIPAVAVRMWSEKDKESWSEEDKENWLLRRAGYSMDFPCILLTNAAGGRRAYYDPYDWGDRTYQTAHLYIVEHWGTLRSGDVIDVRVPLGEALEPVASERESYE